MGVLLFLTRRKTIPTLLGTFGEERLRGKYEQTKGLLAAICPRFSHIT